MTSDEGAPERACKRAIAPLGYASPGGAMKSYRVDIAASALISGTAASLAMTVSA